MNEPSSIAPPIPGVHPELVRYHAELAAQTGLHKVGDKTHSVVGYGGNINFIEGRDGIIVVNTGTTLTLSQGALDLYRASVSDKPVVALIYTHGYADHTGGGRVFAPDGTGVGIEAYASAAWHGFVEQGVSPLLPEVSIRAASQVGWLLPPGVEGTLGNGLTRLSAVAIESGALDRDLLLAQIRGITPSDLILRKPPRQLLGVLGRKLRIDENGARPAFTVAFVVIDRDQTLYATVLPAVMLRGPGPDGGVPGLTLMLSHANLVRGIEGMTGFDTMRAEGSIDVAGSHAVFESFLAAFDW